MKLNKKEIMEHQQNRPPYLMIDFVEEVIPGKSAKGYKNLNENEWFFKVHWPQDPNMPAMLQTEAMVQMCALALLTLPGNKGKLVYLIGADKLNFKKKIVPKDKLFIETKINSFNRGYHTVFKYKKVNTLVINEYELRYELRDKHSEIPKLAKILFKKISAKNIIVTRGRYGSVLVNRKNNLIISCPAFYQNNVDTVGAGDTFFGICGLAIGSKVDNKISMLLGAISAGFAVEQMGNKFYYNFQTLKKHLTHIFK